MKNPRTDILLMLDGWTMIDQYIDHENIADETAYLKP